MGLFDRNKNRDQDNDAWKRLRDREKEEEKREEEAVAEMAKNPTAGVSSDKLDETLGRAEVLIEQLNNLYNMYFSGVDKIPPNEKRKELEQVMLNIVHAVKPTQAVTFRCNGMVSRFNTHRDRWDKMLRALEKNGIGAVRGASTKRAA